MLSQKNFKKAEVTMEVVLSIALSIIALFLILGLFNNHLKTIGTKGRIANMNIEGNKTNFTPQDRDPTQTQISVQMVADQGTLAWYNAQAKGTIERLGKLDSLTNAQVIDLAKSLTVFAESVTPPNYQPGDAFQINALRDTYLAGTTISYGALASNHNISFDWISYTTSVQLSSSNAIYNWYNENVLATPRTPEPQRILNVTSINSTFN